MRSKIQKWGNSLGLRVPKSFADETGIRAGSEIEISIENGALVIRPATRRYDVHELVRAVRKDNLHDEVETGDPVGREGW